MSMPNCQKLKTVVKRSVSVDYETLTPDTGKRNKRSGQES